MRYIYIFMALAFAAFVSICDAIEEKGKAAAARPAAEAHSQAGPIANVGAVDEEGEEAESVKEDVPLRGGEEDWETYDDETGMPDVTESDRLGEVD